MTETKSVNITTIDSGDKVEAGSVYGKKRIFMDTVAVTGTDFDADGDTVVLAEVPPNAKIQSIVLYNDDLDSGADSAPNVGIYNGNTKFTKSDGTDVAADALIDEDAYASAITTLQSANTTGVEVSFEARDINKINNYVWEDAGLSQAPSVPLRIVLTQTAAVAGAQTGDISIAVTYAVA